MACEHRVRKELRALKPKNSSVLFAVRSSLPYIIGLTLGFAVYEALKEVFLPGLTKWESNAFSIFDTLAWPMISPKSYKRPDWTLVPWT